MRSPPSLLEVLRLAAAWRCSLLLVAGVVVAGAVSIGASPQEPQSGFRTGNPADELPPHVRRLTWLGERPDWRHDGERFVFVSKVFGEVYEFEMATGRTYSLSEHFLHHGFTRAMYLANGDILLVGPSATFDRTDPGDRRRARHDIGRAWVLRKPFDKAPLPLGIEVDEGPALSRRTLRLAWTHGAQDRISVGELVYEGDGVRVAQTRLVTDTSRFSDPPEMIETQNFIPPDERRITLAAYKVGGTANTETFSLDLETGALVNLSRSPSSYDEPEGIFPDGRHTTVEHAPHRGNPWPLIDLFKLALDGSGARERLTYFSDYAGWKASQGVVSDDGRFMLFQIGRAGDEAGRGYGIFLHDLEQARGR
jgi:hypothetical protein